MLPVSWEQHCVCCPPAGVSGGRRLELELLYTVPGRQHQLYLPSPAVAVRAAGGLHRGRPVCAGRLDRAASSRRARRSSLGPAATWWCSARMGSYTIPCIVIVACRPCARACARSTACSRIAQPGARLTYRSDVSCCHAASASSYMIMQ